VGLGKLSKATVTPTAAALAELEDVMFIPQRPDAGEPMIDGFYDRQGNLRRVVLRYPDGWRAQVNLNARGFITSSSCSLSIHVKGPAA
jgi:hypothetical protein